MAYLIIGPRTDAHLLFSSMTFCLMTICSKLTLTTETMVMYRMCLSFTAKSVTGGHSLLA